MEARLDTRVSYTRSADRPLIEKTIAFSMLRRHGPRTAFMTAHDVPPCSFGPGRYLRHRTLLSAASSSSLTRRARTREAWAAPIPQRSTTSDLTICPWVSTY